MSFLEKEPKTYINIKFTDQGRKLLSLGQVTFSKAILLDRETDYNIDDNVNLSPYNIEDNKILAPVDNHPTAPPFNLDGTDAHDLTGKDITSHRNISSATTETAGFFEGGWNNFSIRNFDINNQDVRNHSLGYSKIHYSATSIQGEDYITIPTGSTYNNFPFKGIDPVDPIPNYPSKGELVYIPWSPPQNPIDDLDTSTILSANPTVALWYRVISANTKDQKVFLDRKVPDFGDTSSSKKVIRPHFYPFDIGFYANNASMDPKVWHMNIIRTSSVPGTDGTISGFTTYGSIEFNGTKHYLGFRDNTREVGVVHYSNAYTGNTYAERFSENSVELSIPNIMWHKVTGATNGNAIEYGVRLRDMGMDDFVFDNVSGTRYKPLREVESKEIVGRVYHDLKIVVITHSELLTALTYKSNRNFTLPKPIVEQLPVPKPPLNSSNATGLVESGKTYYVSYVVESDSYSQNSSFGYPTYFPCSSIEKIDGELSPSGKKQFLSVRFDADSFPYMRSETGMTSSQFSGTGWNANKVQVMINEVDSDKDKGFDHIPPDNWRLIGTASSVTTPNDCGDVSGGIFTGGTNDNTIDPNKLIAHQFIMSKEDYDVGEQYLMKNNKFSAFTMNNDKLTFGDESFFFGNFDADIIATSFTTKFTIKMPNQEFNSSDDESFESTKDDNTYISEVLILSEDNKVVAVGKPTTPIKKNKSRFLTFQLKLDF